MQYWFHLCRTSAWIGLGVHMSLVLSAPPTSPLPRLSRLSQRPLQSPESHCKPHWLSDTRRCVCFRPSPPASRPAPAHKSVRSAEEAFGRVLCLSHCGRIRAGVIGGHSPGSSGKVPKASGTERVFLFIFKIIPLNPEQLRKSPQYVQINKANILQADFLS